MKPPVGRGHVPAACRNDRLRTCLFVCSVCRFADGWDMSQPYIGCFVYHGAFSRMDCEAQRAVAISCRNSQPRTNPHPKIATGASALAMTNKTPLLCHCEAQRAVAILCRRHRLRTTPFFRTVCRLRGTARRVGVPYDPPMKLLYKVLTVTACYRGRRAMVCWGGIPER